LLSIDTYGFTPNVRFTFKCMIIKRPGMTVLCTLMLSIFILAYILRIFELPYYRKVGAVDLEQYTSAIWLILVTMSTVGFGDIVPYSFVGRMVIIFTSIWGAFIITLVIVAFSSLFSLSKNQKKAMHHLYLTKKAAETITSAMRYYLRLSKHNEKS
jgi:Ion channel